MASLTDEIRAFWNDDAAVYDDALGHAPRSATELAAWRGAIHKLLPPAPARVLDVGAGTGFLSLLLAGLGYEVTALDLAPAMLAQLALKAAAAGLELTTLEGDAASPPREDFDAVVQRHLLWTLPDPSAALEAWREAAPAGRLVLFETNWGSAAGPLEELRSQARELSRRLQGAKPDHHDEYGPSLRAQLPLGHGTSAESLVRLVESTSWGRSRIVLLRDVDWAARRAQPHPLDRLIGLARKFAIVAG